ncbi:MAG: hypothetical protein AMXMBFR58_20420 [Phycisphaerae bacterium]
MATVFIVHAHHEPASFNAAMTQRARRVLAGDGHEVIVSDLYAMGFDPVSDRRNFTTVKDPAFLKQQREEAHASEHDGFSSDIAAEMAKLERCDALIFQFPMWWFGVPAILKGWIDRVMAAGRVYGNGKWYERGAFKGKRAMVAMTTGGPASMFDGWGLNPSLESILRPIQHGVFWFTGFQPLPPFIAWQVSRATTEDRARMLDEYEARLHSLFTTTPLRYPGVDDCDDRYQDRVSRFMVAWTWNGPDTPEIDALIPRERAMLEEWRRDGVLLERWIAADQCSGWLIVRAADRPAVGALLDALPLRRWLACTITPLANA